MQWTFKDELPINDGEVYIPTLNVDKTVEPLCSKLDDMFNEAETINVLRPLKAYRAIRRLRKRLSANQTAFQSAVDGCLKKMSHPVEGAPAIDSGWYQGWSLAMALSNVTRLNLAFSNASATLDRKTSYVVANFSLYVALVSFIVSCIFGWLSLPVR